MSGKFAPWFGSWPPEPWYGYEGEAMQKKQHETWTRLDSVLIGVGLVGIILLLVSPYVAKWAIPYALVLGFGSSAIIACVLGFTIEKVLSRKLAKDAVEAGLGYLILPEAREEMRRIYEQKFLCIEHHSTLTLKGTQFSDYILVNNHTTRKMKNITGKKQSYQARVRYREWFHHDNLQSRLIGFGIHTNSRELHKYKKFISANSVQYELEEEVQLGKGDECIVWYEIEEVKRTTDVYYETFTHPTVNPTITLNVDRGQATTNLNLGVFFGFPSNLESEIIETGKNQKQFQGLLLPYGYIELRWWDNNKMKDWQNAESKEGTQIK